MQATGISRRRAGHINVILGLALLVGASGGLVAIIQGSPEEQSVSNHEAASENGAKRDGHPDSRQSTYLASLLDAGNAGGAPKVVDITGPQATDHQVSLNVARLLQIGHLNRNKQSLDDSAAKRCLRTFLKNLDPWKLYFQQSDVDRFQRKVLTLDDGVRQGDISFAYEAFRVYLKRVDERMKDAEKLLASQQDFSLNETAIVDRDAATYAKNAEQAFDRWRKRVKFDLLVLKTTHKDEKEKFDEKKARRRLSRRYFGHASRMKQTNSDDLLQWYLTSMTTGFDPHTTYMSPTTLENFRIDMGKSLEGIGASLQFEDGITKIVRIVPGGAADKKGQLKTDDEIIGVGEGKEGEIVDVVDMRLSDVVRLIRGKKGTVVRLQVLTGSERKIIDITRARIELKDSVARDIIVQLKSPSGVTHKVGFILLPDFYMDMEAARRGDPNYRSVTRDVRAIIKKFKQENVGSVILDLRLNGGGSLTEAIDLTGLFIDRGPVVQVKGADGKVKQYYDLNRGMEWSGPLVVLTSKLSASASEIFAGAIKDYHRGIIVGDHTTHGKGTVQSLIDLGERIFNRQESPNYGALKITMQQFYRPNGDSTQIRGVLSDIELPSVVSHLKIGEEDLDYAVEFDHVKVADFNAETMVNAQMIKTLGQKSAARVAKSEDFDKVRRRIAFYLKRRDRKTVSINEKAYIADRKEGDTDKELENKIKDSNDLNKPLFDPDNVFYDREVADITGDYLDLIKKFKLAVRR